jgi:hypothetical protein
VETALEAGGSECIPGGDNKSDISRHPVLFSEYTYPK